MLVTEVQMNEEAKMKTRTLAETKMDNFWAIYHINHQCDDYYIHLITKQKGHIRTLFQIIWLLFTFKQRLTAHLYVSYQSY